LPNSEDALNFFKPEGEKINGYMQGHDREFTLSQFDFKKTQKGLVVYLINSSTDSYDESVLLDFYKNNLPRNCRLILAYFEATNLEEMRCDTVDNFLKDSALKSRPMVKITACQGVTPDDIAKQALLLQFLTLPQVNAEISGSAMRRGSAKVMNALRGMFGGAKKSDAAEATAAVAAPALNEGASDAAVESDEEL